MSLLINDNYCQLKNNKRSVKKLSGIFKEMYDTNTIDKFEKQNIFLCSGVLFMKKFRGK